MRASGLLIVETGNPQGLIVVRGTPTMGSLGSAVRPSHIYLSIYVSDQPTLLDMSEGPGELKQRVDNEVMFVVMRWYWWVRIRGNVEGLRLLWQ